MRYKQLSLLLFNMCTFITDENRTTITSMAYIVGVCPLVFFNTKVS